ncbi:hypothetical protein H2200_008510 [Cladophialophora chaetospira]|uniref:Heterokaryon incompatibility domain-containing protein n=1 Tax=Cladophialophora chaetospira TaxID=386627 RepID=A0AA39CGH5_9EURO|nr:hypothetical protein H2200_008510 [Cladophialophora chaetospira]
MEKFSYDEITRADHRIRLFKVSTDTEEPLRCIIKTFDADKCPTTYEALSYTWTIPTSNVEKPRKILLNEKEFVVQENLYNFLKRISQGSIDDNGQPLRPSYLWIDAICINQESTTEKSSQVQHMGRVYERAQRVLAWLGEGDEMTKIAMRLILDTKATYGKSGKLPDSIWKSHPYVERYIRRVFSVGSSLQSELFQSCLDRPRVLLAKGVTMISGGQSIDFEDMSMMYFAHANMRAHELIPKTELPRCVSIFETRRRSMQKSLQEGHRFPALKFVVKDFCTFECSDPRDKIYGLLSLAGDGAEITVDYSKPPSWVYWETMAKWQWFLPVYARRAIQLGVSMQVTGREENAIFRDKKQYGWSYAVLGYSPIDIFADPEEYAERIEKERREDPKQIIRRRSLRRLGATL